jgi:hypothetical protein
MKRQPWRLLDLRDGRIYHRRFLPCTERLCESKDIHERLRLSIESYCTRARIWLDQNVGKLLFLVPEATERKEKDLQRGLTDKIRSIFQAFLMRIDPGFVLKR